MKQVYLVQGIKCASCIEKITALLQNKLSATEISISDNNTKLEFNSSEKISITVLNQLLAKIGDYKVSENLTVAIERTTADNPASSYKPIYLIFTYLIIVNGLIFYENQNLMSLMSNFMAGFFLVFSFFKMLDLQGFAAGYSTYDLVAKKFYYYGYAYPFIELAFGIAFLIEPMSLILNIAVFFIMLISAIGVIKAKLTRQQFTCACAGSFFNVPLGNIAIIENVSMVIMSVYMLFHLISF